MNAFSVGLAQRHVSLMFYSCQTSLRAVIVALSSSLGGILFSVLKSSPLDRKFGLNWTGLNCKRPVFQSSPVQSFLVFNQSS